MSFYIYKHILNNEVVYIGKTINMKNRQKQHSKDKFWFSDDLVIEYTEVTDSMIMDIYEKYYINKYSPKKDDESKIIASEYLNKSIYSPSSI